MPLVREIHQNGDMGMAINNNFADNSLVNITESGQTRKGLKVNGQTNDAALDRAMQDNANLAAVDVEGITSRIDELRNTVVDDNDQYLIGGSGDDNIATFAGDDTVLSGNGNDLVVTNAGDDLVNSGNGDDIVDLGDGDDRAHGGNGNDIIFGGAGADEIEGGNGDDVLYGEEGDDHLMGGNGNDYLNGGSGNDILDGGTGDDVLVAGTGSNTVIGGQGNDTVIFEMSSDNFRMDYDDSGNIVITDAVNDENTTTVSGVENFIFLSDDGEELLTREELMEFIDDMRATQGDDVLTGTDGDDIIDGLDGNDTIDGGAGNDTIDGGAGNDTIDGGAGNDIISGGDGDDTINAGVGNDIIDAGMGNNSVDGAAGTDTIGLAGNRNDYNVIVNDDNSITLTNNNSGDVNTVSNVENFEFANVTMTEQELKDSATRDVVVVQAQTRNLQVALNNWGGAQNDHWENLTAANDEFYQGILNSGNDYSGEGNSSNYYVIDVESGEILEETNINNIQVDEGNITNVSTEGDDGLAQYQGGAKITVNGQQYNVVDVNARRSSPIILDMDGDGIELTSAENGVNFDINADGTTDRTAWTQSGQGFDDAFLTLDRNGNGQIDDGTELFGDQNGAANGYEELAKFDSNQDGQINAQDDIYDELTVWADMDGDGKVDDGEMKGLEEAGITSISTNYDGQVGDSFDEHGNDVSLTSSFTMNEGGQSVTRDTVDAFFVNRDLTNGELVNSLNSELADLQAELQALEGTENYDQDEADTLRSRITIKESEITNAGV
ncbi:MAG: hypothetical protein HRT47_03530 [Candidatus Caenarcaniphilales bacterium]|nr:hypothetical protein [Candidatus Caenarcaniphilales bacterium]